MAERQGEFGGLVRELRTRARLTQQELATAAGVSERAVSGLERGVTTTPQKETVRLLADALHLIGPEREHFETAARGRPLENVTLATAAAAMRSLPRDVASFTGRQQELQQLAKSAVSAGGVVGIHAIGGLAGVGKTAFAVHAAHQLAGQFPGGQVFLHLHGHTPGRTPVDPADALASLLLTIGVPPRQIPPDLEARARLWRDRVAERQLLLVLDDAAGSDQVLPLLPGAGGSLVLVTSRRHLSALDDATAISLDTLPPDQAAALLVRLAGRAGLSADDPAVARITQLCGCLPLAVGMVGRQLRHHPAWTAAGRAAELAAARDRLELMETENLSVAAAFDLSYADLTEAQQRLFRRIGLHPGDDIDAHAAAALDGTSPSAARRGLEALYDQYLLSEPVQGRFRLHDLIREHARAQAARVDPDGERVAAISRLLDYYQQTSAAANARIFRRTRPGPTADGSGSAAVPDLADMQQALDWARAERASLLACLDYAADGGQHARVIALTAGISALLQQDGWWADAVARHRAAALAAERLGDPLACANALSDLGEARRVSGDFPAAVRALEEALAMYREVGDRLGQGNVLSSLGDVRRVTGDFPAAVRALEEALDLYCEVADRHGQAEALHRLGDVRRLTGDYQVAVIALEEALDMHRELGDRLGQSNVLNMLGALRSETGDFPAAIQALDEALDLCRDLGYRLGQANALATLGLVLRQTGDFSAAMRALEEGLGLYRDLSERLGQANSLYFLGAVLRLTGDYPAAAQALDEALGLYRDLGSRGGEAMALNERGALHWVSGELALAQKCHQRSLELSRDIDSSWDEAHALAGLGRCALANGERVQAESLLRQALEIFQRSGAAEVSELLAEVDALPGQRPG
jgi:tetratricopeptide (TPR) repeat protein/transcriptional regulator with XRE-family HTH domain